MAAEKLAHLSLSTPYNRTKDTTELFNKYSSCDYKQKSIKNVKEMNALLLKH